jgi:hypothetical protein
MLTLTFVLDLAETIALEASLYLILQSRRTSTVVQSPQICSLQPPSLPPTSKSHNSSLTTVIGSPTTGTKRKAETSSSSTHPKRVKFTTAKVSAPELRKPVYVS